MRSFLTIIFLTLSLNIFSQVKSSFILKDENGDVTEIFCWCIKSGDYKFDSLLLTFQNYSKLRELRILDCPISKIPRGIWDLKELENLLIENAGLEEIPAEIGRLKKLKKLNLGGNKLTTIPWHALPRDSLYELQLYWNLITEIPDSLFLLQNLEILGLTKNKLIDVTPLIYKMPNLYSVSLGVNRDLILPNSNVDNYKFISINLADCSLTGIPQALYHLKGVERIDLMDNKLKKLNYRLLKNKNLSYINIHDNQFSNWERFKIWLLKGRVRVIF